MELNPEQPTDFDACKAAARDVLRSGTMHLVAVHFQKEPLYAREMETFIHIPLSLFQRLQ